MTSLLNDVRVGAQVPRIRLVPAAAESEGPDAVWLASQYGMVADDWQELAVTDTLCLQSSGLWAAPRVGWSVARQNGKNGGLEIVELHKMAVMGRRILHTAHQVKTAMKAFKRLLYFFDNPMFPDLAAMVVDLRKTNGQEAIFLDNGASFELIARSKASGRGFSVDDLVCDEAQDMSADEYEALLPTISAARNPQTILTGTPPKPGSARGEMFARFRQAGIEGRDPRLCWLEWSALPDADLDDRNAWRQANPAIGIRLSYDFTSDERAAMSDEGFARERLGIWSEVGISRVIDADKWASIADPNSSIDDELVFGVEVGGEQGHASIGAAGWRGDGRLHLEHIENAPGTGWVVQACVELNQQKPRGFVIDQTSPTGSLIQPLREAGLNVIAVGQQGNAQACGRLFDSVMSSLAVHLDQPTLNFALSVAQKRVLPEGAWLWHRRKAESDITPIVAVTLAIHGLSAKKPYDPSVEQKVVILE